MSETGKRIVGEERKVFCWCGEEFISEQERDNHRATSSDDKRHGPMPHESPLIGGACIIVNLENGNVEVSCKRLKIYGEGDETSSHGEAEMVTQAAIQLTKRALSLSETDHVAFYTDNKSVVQGTDEHVLATPKNSRFLRSKIRETLRRLKVAMNMIQSTGASIHIFGLGGWTINLSRVD
jgi:ribonuclease HI